MPRGAAAVLAGFITVRATSLKGVVLMNATLNASTTTIDRHQRQALQKLIDVLISTAIANSGKTEGFSEKEDNIPVMNCAAVRLKSIKVHLICVQASGSVSE